MKKETIAQRVWLSVIAGGNGTRLFLFSNDSCPKQFCSLDEENTFIQATIKRFLNLGVSPAHVLIIVTNDNQRELAIKQTTERFSVITDNILTIDANHDYAGSMVIATKAIKAIDPEAIIIQTPSDQYIDANESFSGTINTAIDLAAEQQKQVLIGKKIFDVNTAIELGNIIYDDKGDNLKIENFIEKPDRDTITQIMRSGKNTACNTGINIWPASTFSDDTPDIKITTDYLINNILHDKTLVIGDFTWNDLGNFHALYTVNAQKSCSSIVKLGCKERIRSSEDCSTCLLITDPSIELNVTSATGVAIVAREINDGNCYLEIADLKAIRGVANAAQIYKTNREAFDKGVTIGGKNNDFSTPYPSRYHACFIGVSNYKVYTYNRDSGKKGFQIFKDL